MPRNDEGEFELVLGNRQLLSVFFIVVVLLGVFFVMGYILGKNSSPAPVTELVSARKPAETGPAPNPIIIDKGAGKNSAVGDPASERPVAVEKATEKPTTKAQEVPPELKKPETKKAEAVKPEPVKPEPKKEEPKREASKPESRAGEPPKGSLFLQVAAVGRAEADVVAKVLKGKGYSIWIAPSDKDAVVRVLVGPIQKTELGTTRAELNSLGFQPFPRSY